VIAVFRIAKDKILRIVVIEAIMFLIAIMPKIPTHEIDEYALSLSVHCTNETSMLRFVVPIDNGNHLPLPDRDQESGDFCGNYVFPFRGMVRSARA